MKFRGDSDYTASFERAATRLIDTEIEDRTERMTAVQTLIDEYIAETGKRPNSRILERLTDYILREELNNKNPDKVTQEEYPFLSERQAELRHKREYAIHHLKIAGKYDADGKDCVAPTRRHRRDTSSGPVVSYNLRKPMG